MARERIRFGVDLDRETDAQFEKIAKSEERSKRNMHGVLIRRVVQMWKSDPDKLITLGLIRKVVE